VAYHQNFWIAVAAAAPVIALAAVVAFTDTARVGGVGQIRPAGADPNLLKMVRWGIWGGHAAGLVNVLLQAATLLLALLSLAAGHDQAPLIVAEITAPLGIFLLVVGGAIGAFLRVIVGVIDQGVDLNSSRRVPGGGVVSRDGHEPAIEGDDEDVEHRRPAHSPARPSDPGEVRADDVEL
jgi:hypothetical protein